MHLNKIRRNIRIHLFKPGIIFDPKGGKPHIHGDLFHCTCHVCVINRTWVKWKQSKYVLYWSTNTFIIFSFLEKKCSMYYGKGSGISRRGYKAFCRKLHCSVRHPSSLEPFQRCEQNGCLHLCFAALAQHGSKEQGLPVWDGEAPCNTKCFATHYSYAAGNDMFGYQLNNWCPCRVDWIKCK